MHFRLDVYSHYVKVTGFSKQGKDVLLDFCKPLAQYGLVRLAYNKFVRKMLRIFAGATKDRLEFRFHIHQFESLVQHLKLYSPGEASIDIHHHLPPIGDTIDFKVRDNFIMRDYQVPIKDYLLNDQKVNILKLQTGKGKTLMAFVAVEGLMTRALLVVKAQYIPQWIEKFNECIDHGKGDLMVVQGSAHLRALIDLGMNKQLEAKFIIISTTTLYNYINEYETTHGVDMTYPIPPDLLCETLGIGVRLIDESHLNFHLNFRIDLYTHVRKTIALTATLDSNDPFKNKMYKIAFPPHLRYQGAVYDKYIAVKALFYQINKMDKLRFKNKGRDSYSHMEFEKSLMKQSDILENYINMLVWVVKDYFIPVRQPGQKMLIFAASIKLCTILTERFKKIWPELNVQRYVDDDDYHEMLKGDLLVSTLLSSGTAIDIPGLRIALMTTALGSRELNEQALGRLRRLNEWPDVVPEFLYLVCENIPKHVEYHEIKKEFFADKVLSHQDLTLPLRV